MDKLLLEALEIGKKYTDQGQIVDYIPALATADRNKIGASLIDKEGNIFEAGHVEEKFSMMSIVKIILYLVALENYEFDFLKTKVGLKGSSKAFNSLLDLEMSEDKKPVNPFINSGALTISYLIYDKFGKEGINVVLDKIKKLSDNETIDYDMGIVETVRPTGQANKAIMYTLEKNGIIPISVDIYEVLDIYNKACSIMVNTRDLAKISYVLSSGGYNHKKEKLMDEKHARLIRTLMAVAGMYDSSGDFAVEIGIPAKSGVGGGIIATTQGGYGLATFGPALDKAGNSVSGIKMLEYISEKLKLNIY